jgi:hypothetical protein
MTSLEDLKPGMHSWVSSISRWSLWIFIKGDYELAASKGTSQRKGNSPHKDWPTIQDNCCKRSHADYRGKLWKSIHNHAG